MSRKANSKTAQAPDTCRQHVGSSCAVHNLQWIVQDFIIVYRERSARELRFYKIQPTLERAIEVAALAQLPSGKRHPHQRRIPQAVLEEVRDCLLSTNLQAYKTFSELIAAVKLHISNIKGIGDLTVYDTTHRIGAYLGLEPEIVYLHAGTREGARAIGIAKGQKTVRIDELPSPFHMLTPSEVEDCLCLYKDELSQ